MIFQHALLLLIGNRGCNWSTIKSLVDDDNGGTYKDKGVHQACADMY